MFKFLVDFAVLLMTSLAYCYRSKFLLDVSLFILTAFEKKIDPQRNPEGVINNSYTGSESHAMQTHILLCFLE